MTSRESHHATLKTGVLLLNVGTPDSPAVKDVRRYLREFLTDHRVLTMPAWIRYLLVHGIIAPFRGPKSARAYKTIWTKAGSPLLRNSLDLAQNLEQSLGDSYRVRLAMRYGQPRVTDQLAQLLDQDRVDQLILMPLYPQYSSSATGSALDKVFAELRERTVIPKLIVAGDFYADSRFVGALASMAKERLAAFKADHVLMSYHGLPESHVKASTNGFCDPKLTNMDPSKVSGLTNCCERIGFNNRFCYRAQCYATSKALATELGLSSSQYSVAFQSRLGRTPWIQPFTDKILADLHGKGVRRLAVTVPSFVADCLETIEEIGDRAKKDWLNLGGEDFQLIPCLNSDPKWVEGLTWMIKELES